MADYTGPTSGRITIGGGIDPEITRESWTQETDPVLTKGENAAVRWFRDLPPNAQLRKVNELKFNLDTAQDTVARFRRHIQEQESEIHRLRAELATHVPHGGYAWPRAARDLLDHAKAHGWRTAYAWQEIKPRDAEDDQEPYARLAVKIGKDGRTFEYTWACDRDGRGRMTGRALEWRPGWHYAPSLLKLKKMITDDQ